jgi:hypothetical protein
MSRRRWLGLVAGILAGLACLRLIASAAGEGKNEGPFDNPFSDQIVLASVQSWPHQVLAQVEIKRLGDKYYLVGKVVDIVEVLGGVEKWTKGATLWIPLGQVDRIVAFKSLEEYRKNVSRSEGKPADRSQSSRLR